VSQPKWGLEIEYLFQKDKSEKPQTSWFYFWDNSVKYETAVRRAEKHFKTLLTNSGWTRYTTLVAIRPIPNAKTQPVTVVVQPDPPAPTRKSRRNSTNSKSTTKTNPRPKPNASGSVKPKANRKPAATTKPKTSTTPRTPAKRGGSGKRKTK